MSDDDVDSWISIAAGFHSPGKYGANYTTALAFYTAHLIKMTGPEATADTDAGGPVSGKKAGDLSVSYSVPSNAADSQSAAWLAQTRYGRAYLASRAARSKARPRVISLGSSS